MCQFSSQTIGAVSSGGGSRSGQGQPAIGAQELGREDPAGHTKDCPPRPETPAPPAVSVPAAAAAAAATARIPRQARVTPLLLQHLGPDGENLTQVCSEYFLGARNRGSGNALRPVFVPEPLSLNQDSEVSLFWGRCSEPSCAFWNRFCFSAGAASKPGGKCWAVNLRISGKSWANSLLAAAGPWPDWGQIFLSQDTPGAP